MGKMPKLSPHVWRLIQTIAVIWTFAVMAIGAYTRLTDAGLGCPDWPGCYGSWIVPHWQGLDPALGAILRDTTAQAWTEMIHRYAAGGLGLVLLAVAVGAFVNRQDRGWAVLLLVVLAFQAYLGQATVTLKLHPMVVVGHLLGGTLILGIVLWMRLNHANFSVLAPHPSRAQKITWLVRLGLLLIAIQIALGGWTSANYAGVVCPGFPACVSTGPQPEGAPWSDAFAIPDWSRPELFLNKTYPERVTIQMTHRYMALLVGLWLLHLSVLLIQYATGFLKKMGFFLGIGLLTQVTLGAISVLFALPLWAALLHHHVAIWLAMGLLTTAHCLQRSK